MDIDARYEFLEKVGSGSFATVYRARDKELGREVAIKQIHQQYLDQPKQLDRYWQEAQLLASLQHPNIVTIFDIYRDRGWLILELMQSNLAERMAGRQMDLRSLRTTIAHCLRALKYLHSRGVIHGDVKPSNMMIDARRRVKLGDFGLARRVSDEDGSLLKGTTKYMAPEVVSDEFGDIGASSDLYSLGFASYELMCGPNFESLFPGLSAFGRNKQVAWMMWHAAADRKLPPISRVLEGVPEDVSHVIEKLTQKKQSQRYESADLALSDLKIDLKVIDKGEPEVADEPAGFDPQRKKRLMLAASAFVASVIICLVVFFLPGNTTPSPKVDAWFITEVNVKDRVLTVVDVAGKREKDIPIGRNALISLELGGEPEPAVLRKLQAGDRIEIEYVEDEGKSVMKINAARPYLSGGLVEMVNMQERILTMVIDDGDGQGALPLRIPERLNVVLNLDREEWDRAKPGDDREQLKRRYRFRISDVREQDRLEAYHLPELGRKRGRVLTGILFVHRIREASGTVVDVDAPRERLTVQMPNRRLNLPLHEECPITLAKSGNAAVPAKIAEIQKGDAITFKYDIVFRELHAVRGAGSLTGSIDLVREAKREFVVSNETVAVNDATRVQINGEPAAFADLRTNDRVTVLLADAAGSPRRAASVTATRPPRSNRRVLLAGVRRFDDKSLPELGYSTANVSLLKTAMQKRYAVQQDRLVTLDDPTVATLKSQVIDVLNRAAESVQVVIYISTYALTVDGKVYLAGRKIDPQRIAETGWALDDLLIRVEACRSKNKLLLLDVSHKQLGKSSAEAMLKRAQTSLKSTVVIGNCSGDERGGFHADKTHGLFAHALAAGFRGPADADRNLTITPAELFPDLSKRMQAAATPQTPARLPAKK